ncbi:MAG: discoidin domain-containing protein, partial [Clostridia bacterium]|nr:discoidin domain-containing protein [Clostridia bacterium]
FSKTAGYGAVTLDSAKQAETLGYDVVGGVNASFFDFTGSSCNTYGGVTIFDGKVMHGTTSPTSTATWVMTVDSEGKTGLVKSLLSYAVSANGGAWTAPIECINACPDSASATKTGIYYYDSFSGTTTFTKATGVEIVFEKLDNTELIVGGTLRGKVVAVRSSTAANGAVGENQFVLYASNSSDYAASLRALVVGDIVEVTANENMLDAREAMENCVSAFPTYGYDLVLDGKSVVSSISLGEAFATQRAQRSGIGVKADGTIVIVATQGRGTYTGLTLYELADYFISQGCVTAIDLDGGGSTQMTVENTSGTLTAPISFGRRVANSILIVKRPTISSDDKATLGGLIKEANNVPNKTAYLNEALVNATDVYESTTAMPGDYTRAIMELQDGISESGKTNLVAGMDYTTTGSISSDYITDLTDGTAEDCGDLSAWNGWSSNGTIVFDLGKPYNIDKIRIHLMDRADYAIKSPVIKVAFSNDGKNYTTHSAEFPVVSVNSAYWTEADNLNSTARYVRITLTLNGGFGFVNEVEVLGDDYDVNIALGKDYVVEGEIGEQYNYTTPLTDGVVYETTSITKNRWLGLHSDGSVTLDLGGVYKLDKIRVHSLNIASYGICSANLSVSVSNDGKVFTDCAATFTTQTEDGYYWSELDNIAIAGRYIRININRTGSWAFLNEIELYGSSNLAFDADYEIDTDGGHGDLNSKYHENGERLTDGSKLVGDVNNDNYVDGVSAINTGYTRWVDASYVDIIVDLGGILPTNTYTLYSVSGFYGYTPIKNVSISVSNDGKSFTDIYGQICVQEVAGDAEPYDGAVPTMYKYTVTAAEYVNARYVKFRVLACDEYGYAGVDEVEVTAELDSKLSSTHENLLSGLAHTSTTGSEKGALTYTADITDGIAYTDTNAGYWFGIRSSSLDSKNCNTVNDVADFIYDLGAVYELSDARIHVRNYTGSGICPPKSMKIWVSDDGVNYSQSADFAIDMTNGICYWSTADVADLKGRFIKITVEMNADKSNGGGGWVMLNEIEVYGEEYKIPTGIYDVDYAVNGDEVKFTVVTSPDFERIKVTTADNLGGLINSTASYAINKDGYAVYTITVPAVVGKTVNYAIDGIVDGSYLGEYSYVDVLVPIPTGIYDVTYVVDGENVIFTVVASTDYDEIKVTTASDMAGAISTSSSYTINEDGYAVYTLTVPAINGKTTYVFDGSKGGYMNEPFYINVTAEVEVELYKSVSYEIVDDKIVFTVVTAAGDYNRIKVANAAAVGTSLGVGTSYTLDEKGNYVWTVKTNAPKETTTYAFDLRTTANKYLKDYYMVEVEYVDTEIYKSVSYAIEGDKIVFTVVTLAGDFNRIKVANATATGTSLGVGTYTVDENGNYVWTVKANAPKETTTYAFDLRTSEMKYLKDYHEFKVEVVETVEIFKSTSYEIVDGKVIFTAITPAGDYNRVKIALLDNITSYVKYVDTYTVNADGDYVWTLKFNAPTAVTEYALDIRVASIMKYVKDYYYVSVDPNKSEPETDTAYISANGEINDGKLTFTIVTKPTDINRVKVMLT